MREGGGREGQESVRGREGCSCNFLRAGCGLDHLQRKVQLQSPLQPLITLITHITYTTIQPVSTHISIIVYYSYTYTGSGWQEVVMVSSTIYSTQTPTHSHRQCGTSAEPSDLYPVQSLHCCTDSFLCVHFLSCKLERSIQYD